MGKAIDLQMGPDGVWTPAPSARRVPPRRRSSRLNQDTEEVRPSDRHQARAEVPPFPRDPATAEARAAGSAVAAAPVPVCVVCGAQATHAVQHAWGLTPICEAHAQIVQFGVRQGQQYAAKQLQGLLSRLFGGSR